MSTAPTPAPPPTAGPTSTRQAAPLLTTDAGQKILMSGIVAKTMATRKDLYVLNCIVGRVDNHGNDRTSKKVAQILETLAAAFGAENGAVAAGKAKVKREAPATSTAAWRQACMMHV